MNGDVFFFLMPDRANRQAALADPKDRFGFGQLNAGFPEFFV